MHKIISAIRRESDKKDGIYEHATEKYLYSSHFKSLFFILLKTAAKT